MRPREGPAGWPASQPASQETAALSAKGLRNSRPRRNLMAGFQTQSAAIWLGSSSELQDTKLVVVCNRLVSALSGQNKAPKWAREQPKSALAQPSAGISPGAPERSAAWSWPWRRICRPKSPASSHFSNCNYRNCFFSPSPSHKSAINRGRCCYTTTTTTTTTNYNSNSNNKSTVSLGRPGRNNNGRVAYSFNSLGSAGVCGGRLAPPGELARRGPFRRCIWLRPRAGRSIMNCHSRYIVVSALVARGFALRLACLIERRRRRRRHVTREASGRKILGRRLLARVSPAGYIEPDISPVAARQSIISIAK